MTDDDDRRRSALHEAGHSYVAHTLGREVGGLSITPGLTASGVSFCGGTPYRADDWARLDKTKSITLWPPGIRASFEGDALVAVAGDGAEHTLFRPSRDVAVRVPEPVHVTAADMVITEAERLRFFSGTDRPHLSDEEALALVAHEVYPNDLGAQVACDPVEVVVVHDLGEGLDDVGEGGHDVHVQPCALRRLPVRREVVGG